MKQTLLTICLIVFALPSWGEDIDTLDLIKRNGLYFKEFSNIPFSGKVNSPTTGIGNFKNGKRDGIFLYYWKETGQLKNKDEFKDGIKEGVWEAYHYNGNLKYKGVYKKDKKAIILAKNVEKQSNAYKRQLIECQKNLDKKKFIIF